MTRTDLRVLVDSKRFSFVSTNGMEPTFFDDNVVWKLQVRNFLPVFGSVILFGTVWNTTKNWRPSHQAAIFIFQVDRSQSLFVLHRVHR